MMGNFETPNTRGLSQRELLLEVRHEVKELRTELSEEVKRIDKELGARPTRPEMVRSTGVGIAMATFLGGLIFGILSVV